MKIRLAICVPVYGDTKAKFTHSMTAAIIHFLQCRMVDMEGNAIEREAEVFLVTSSNLIENRHRLVGEALVWGATHLLWLDADHVFPHDTIPRLLSHNVDVAGANYARRCTPTAPTACKLEPTEDDADIKNLVYTTAEKARDGVLEEVAHVGFGVCLMHMAVFDMLQVHAEQTGDGNFLPLFKFGEAEGKAGPIGEDVWFFNKLRAAGGKVFVDHGLSWEVGHIGEHILTNAHANAHKEKWKERQDKTREKYEKAIEAAEAEEKEAA